MSVQHSGNGPGHGRGRGSRAQGRSPIRSLGERGVPEPYQTLTQSPVFFTSDLGVTFGWRGEIGLRGGCLGQCLSGGYSLLGVTQSERRGLKARATHTAMGGGAEEGGHFRLESQEMVPEEGSFGPGLTG